MKADVRALPKHSRFAQFILQHNKYTIVCVCTHLTFILMLWSNTFIKRASFEFSNGYHFILGFITIVVYHYYFTLFFFFELYTSFFQSLYSHFFFVILSYSMHFATIRSQTDINTSNHTLLNLYQKNIFPLLNDTHKSTFVYERNWIE